MTSVGTVPLRDIWAMLDVCAPGYTKKSTEHHWRVYYRGFVYPSLPLGKHGRRSNPEIEVGHVRHMARKFEIMDCARKCLAQLR